MRSPSAIRRPERSYRARNPCRTPSGWRTAISDAGAGVEARTRAARPPRRRARVSTGEDRARDVPQAASARRGRADLHPALELPGFSDPSGIDFQRGAAMTSTARIRGILLEPRKEWPLIAAEPTTPASIYTGWVLPLAAIGPVAHLIGFSVFGVRIPFAGRVVLPFSNVFSAAVMRYLGSLAGI